MDFSNSNMCRVDVPIVAMPVGIAGIVHIEVGIPKNIHPLLGSHIAHTDETIFVEKSYNKYFSSGYCVCVVGDGNKKIMVNDIIEGINISPNISLAACKLIEKIKIKG